MFDPKQYLSEMWSPTDCGVLELDSYAWGNMEPEIRSGIRTMNLTLFLLLVGSTLLHSHLKLDGLCLYTYSVMAILSFHMYWSARSIKGIKALFLSGTTMKVHWNTSVVLLAHRAASFTGDVFITIEIYHAADKALYAAKKVNGIHIAREITSFPAGEKYPLLTSQNQGFA